ncbi:inhibitor of nuclear factor kappa-B kinase subunit beta-like isoform X2 [Leptopilina boulardi]|nr:inhibitor of nuclear factor kappa-B kinase subunit beta-like isoform X2 [Leptopilina boulardi]
MNHLKHENLVASVKLPEELQSIQTVVPVLCMEFCSKGDLRKLLNNFKNVFGFEQFKAVKIISDVSSGVEFLHQNKITHRDLKPENIVIKERNGEITCKLIDLGYAKELGQDSLYASLVGTLNYVAPELFWNKKYSCSVDYWSLGILFYEVLTGTRPFLPYMKHTVKWMEAVQRKKYDQICAHQIGEQIYFYSEIADPTDLSEFLRDNLVEWFRVSLQWDPKKRGKIDNTNEIVLFDLLKKILSKQELHAFVVSQYRVVTFLVNEKTTLEDLQQWIEEKTDIPIHQQTITAFECRILNNNEPVLSQINIQSKIPHILVFKTGNLHLEKLPNQKLPKSIESVIEKPHEKFEYCQRIKFIKAVMFFINQEIRLSKWYQISLSIKIDLLDQRSVELDENLKSEIESLSTLKFAVEETLKTETKFTEKQKLAFQQIIKKIDEKPLRTITQMAKRSKILNQVNHELRTFSEINWINDFSTLFDKVADVFISEDHTLIKSDVESTTKIFFRFLELKSLNIEKNKNIIEATERISFLEDELSKLEKFSNSANVLKKLYTSEFETLKKSLESTQLRHLKSEEESKKLRISSFSNNSLNTNFQTQLSNESDNLIRDSLVIRYMMSNLVSKLQEEVPIMLDLDS